MGALLSAALLSAPAARATPFLISAPIRVPLFHTQISAGFSTPTDKLGIYASLGGSGTPQLFEFDTGGAGFYATYYSADGINPDTPWWGPGQTATGYTFEQSYDGGNIKYKGDIVTTTVNLFAGASSSTPLLSATNVSVGQTSEIKNNNAITWPFTPPAPPYTGVTPPLEGAFWGDFGMAPQQGKDGKTNQGSNAGSPTLDSLVSQLAFGAGVKAGYRVHASDANPWVQFGLAPEDLVTLPTTYALNRPPSGSPSQSPAGVDYTDKYVVTGSLDVSSIDCSLSGPSTGIIFDTGAFTTIHDDARICKELIDGGHVVNGADVVMAAISLQPGLLALTVPFLSFQAGPTNDVDLVAVQPDSSYYLNTGILPFLSHDIIYSLDSSAGFQLTLVPQQVPEPLSSAGLAAAAAISRRLRRLRRRVRGAEAGEPAPHQLSHGAASVSLVSREE